MDASACAVVPRRYCARGISRLQLRWNRALRRSARRAATNLLIEGVHFHIPKGYTYFAMAFAVAVEMINLRVRRKSDPVHLHQEVV
jgi:hypothetical protein